MLDLFQLDDVCFCEDFHGVVRKLSVCACLLLCRRTTGAAAFPLTVRCGGGNVQFGEDGMPCDTSPARPRPDEQDASKRACPERLDDFPIAELDPAACLCL